MKKKHYPLLALISVMAASCGPTCYDPSCEVLQQTYVHKYGVEVAPEDWSARGQCGQVQSTLKDGTTETRQYNNGILHGDCTYTFPHSSTVARKESYHQGALLSQTHYYRSGGAFQEVVPINAARKQVTTWFESGEPKSIEEYEGELLISGTYYTPDHATEAKVDDGNGVRIQRDPYGQLIAREEIKKGIPVKATTFHPNGSPKEVTPLANGLPEGSVQTFLPDGEPSVVSQVHQGVQHGLTVIYENGEVVAKIPYNNGVVDGVEERYKDGNVLATEVTWVSGMRHGPTYHYAGEMVTTDWFFRDQPVSKTDFEILSQRERRFN